MTSTHVKLDLQYMTVDYNGNMLYYRSLMLKSIKIIQLLKYLTKNNITTSI